jgi:hypothetical protein
MVPRSRHAAYGLSLVPQRNQHAPKEPQVPKQNAIQYPRSSLPHNSRNRDSAHPIVGITKRGHRCGVQYDLTGPCTLTRIFLLSATPCINASLTSHPDSPHDSSRTRGSIEMTERPRHSARGVRLIVRRHAFSNRLHPTRSLTLNPFAHSPFKTYDPQETCNNLQPLGCGRKQHPPH